MVKLSVVVPCYNEEATLVPFIEAMLPIEEQLSEVVFEYIFVNDGSKDKTLSVLQTLCSNYPDKLYYVSFSRNFGKEAAILAGMQASTGDYVVLMDVDLQDPPALIPQMYYLLQDSHADVVATRRTSRKGEPVIRSFFATMYYKLNNMISEVKLEEGARDFRLMTRQVVDAVLQLPENNRFSKGIFSWVGFDVEYIEYENIERQQGETSWSFQQLLRYAIEGMISFSDVPLKLVSYIGVATFVLAMVYGLYIIGKTLIFGVITPGWASLAVLVVGMGGLQLLCLGIVGKYIAKIFLESKKRPLYFIKESKLPK